MWILASVPVQAWGPIALAVAAIVGMVFAALRFNREDSTAVVKQAVEMVSGMRELNVELQHTLDRLRGERDKLRDERDHLAAEVGKLGNEVHLLSVRVEELRAER